MSETHKPNLKTLADKWPSSLVARQEAKKFSGGIISEKTLANLDSQGIGPAGRLRIGRKVAYSVSSLIEFLEGRATRLN